MLSQPSTCSGTSGSRSSSIPTAPGWSSSRATSPTSGSRRRNWRRPRPRRSRVEQPRFDHVAVTVADLPAALAFWRDRFGFEVIGEIRHHGDPRGFLMTYLQAGQAVLEVFSFDAADRAEPPVGAGSSSARVHGGSFVDAPGRAATGRARRVPVTTGGSDEPGPGHRVERRDRCGDRRVLEVQGHQVIRHARERRTCRRCRRPDRRPTADRGTWSGISVAAVDAGAGGSGAADRGAGGRRAQRRLGSKGDEPADDRGRPGADLPDQRAGAAAADLAAAEAAADRVRQLGLDRPREDPARRPAARAEWTARRGVRGLQAGDDRARLRPRPALAGGAVERGPSRLGQHEDERLRGTADRCPGRRHRRLAGGSDDPAALVTGTFFQDRKAIEVNPQAYDPPSRPPSSPTACTLTGTSLPD